LSTDIATEKKQGVHLCKQLGSVSLTHMRTWK